LKYDTIWKKLGDDALREGLHPGPPGYEFLKFPSILKTIEFDTSVSIQYSIGTAISTKLLLEHTVQS
jgi:hypothetical protein